MRPKKRILIIDPNELRTSILRYQLTIRGYAAFAAATAAEAREQFTACAPELVIAALNVDGLDGLLTDLHQRDSFCRQLVLVPKYGECKVIVDAVMCEPSPAELLERIKILCYRKRGPRPEHSIDRMLALAGATRRIA